MEYFAKSMARLRRHPSAGFRSRRCCGGPSSLVAGLDRSGRRKRLRVGDRITAQLEQWNNGVRSALSW